MKLSPKQAEVIKLLQEGWELGIDVYTSGHLRTYEQARLQKDGLGRGDPCAYFRPNVIYALERKGLIAHEPNQYIMIEPTRFRLTEKGKELKI